MTPQITTRRTMTAGPLTLAGGTVAAAVLLSVTAAPAGAETTVAEPSSFTSAFTVMATPDQVLDAQGAPKPGEPGASGTFTFRINSDENIICYDITLNGVSGEYMSPAKTATHIHQAAAGKAGPPRLAFPNPAPVGDGPRTSNGCLQGPFTTGLTPEGADADSGTGFTLAQIEADPASFAADTHTVAFTAGAVRGQLTQIPVGGVDAGGGGSASSSVVTPAVGVAALGVAALAGAGLVLRKRNGTQS